MTKSDLPILLVEDDENDVFFFERALKHAEFLNSLRTVRDGREAIAYLSGTGLFSDRDRSPLPCLVVLDLNLPHKHGLEVLQWIRAAAPDPHVPVIVLTSSTSDLDIHAAYKLGANSYLTKPSRPDELVQLVRAFKLYWFDFNRVASTRINPSPVASAQVSVAAD
jgi:DNA-binding response OmpR family regulator